MVWLFERTVQAWCQQDAARHAFNGLSLWAIDGITLRTPDSPANREHFGAQGYASGKVASYPQVRAATLTSLPTHLVANIAFDRYETNEMLYAKQLLERWMARSIRVLDAAGCERVLLTSLTDRRRFKAADLR
ncbi:hypothetical protein BLA24064_04179 [Burkholderia latens]|uniref:Uncharacterized protein n=1 Tax=Burkholderia latens TaxID=488446 RepID=A0A6P2MZX0_9BURK|nr:hypothetical protein BLA24064_04179 [Burkholderia latens]